MTNSSETQHTIDKKRDAGYYAVDAKRVFQVFEIFQMRPSHFTASGKSGAQSVYYDARKIIQNRTNNKWGHHTSGAIKDFCHFTESENGAVLPWQELVEHRGFYDGKEGGGRRTGNVLQTENRLLLNHQALILARQQCEFSQQQLAKKTCLPLQFIDEMEAGKWTTVTETTASTILKVLSLDDDSVFSIISDTSEHDAEITPHAPPITSDHRKMSKAWLLLFPVMGLVFFAGYQFRSIAKLSMINSDQTVKHQNDTLDKINRTSFIKTLSGCWSWSNGAYIVINKNGTANNGPFIATWKVVDINKGHYTIIWPSFIDTLSLSKDGNMLSGHNNYDLPVTAIRKAGNKTDFIGSWLWGSGITMEARADSVIIGGSLNGLWHKVGDSFVIEWPLVDSIKLSDDGLSLSTKNQFGSITAKRDVSCKVKKASKGLKNN